MNWLEDLFSKVTGFFSSTKGKETIATLNTLVGIALPIVQNVAALTGNAGGAATVASVQKAYTTYGVPLATTLESGNATSIGNSLMNLATVVLQKNLPADKSGVATSLLNSAVSLAVVASKIN